MTNKPIASIQVVVDDRERPSGVVGELEKLSGVTIKMEQLAVRGHGLWSMSSGGGRSNLNLNSVCSALTRAIVADPFS